MYMIRFNLTTKEIEIEGSESFIDTLFNEIKELAAERSQVRNTRAERRDEDAPEGFWAERKDSKLIAATGKPELHETRKTETAEIQRDMKPLRPPVQKYILRKAGRTTTPDQIATLAKETAGKVSLVSLKDKLGLTEQQISGILREAEKQGMVRKDADGSYVWA
jgi:hypothetical protein